MAATRFFCIPNFEKWQHYKDRNPPWIKLHRDILNNYAFSSMADDSKAHLLLIWVLASQTDNKIPFDAEWVKARIGAVSTVDLEELQELGFIDIAPC